MFDSRSKALELLDRGFTPLFVSLGTKRPRHQNWSNIVQTRENVERQFSRPANVGIRTGDVHEDGSCLVGVDIDRDDHQLIACAERAIGEIVPAKRGKKGCTLFFRLTEQMPSRKIYWNRDGKRTAVIDVLCRGAQSVVPPSIHPETGLPNDWVAGTPLDQGNYEDLPLRTPTVIDEIRGFCSREDDPVYALNHMEWLGEGGGGNTHDTCIAAVASMVARKWPEQDIHARVQRAKREACERAGLPYDWPKSDKVIQEWIDSSRGKDFDRATVPKKVSHGSLAQAYLDEMRPRILYDEDKNTWFGFSGSHWQPNHDAGVRHSIEQFLPPEARNRGLVKGIEESLRDRPEMRTSSDAWDPASDLLNTPAGTVDLRTGAMRPFDPNDRITRCTSVAPDFDFAGSLWLKKADEWFGPDEREQSYIQTLAGYICSGETREHCLPLWIGPGGDGKSVITGAWAHVLGTYAGVATDTAFLDTRQAQHSEELAMLNGFRLVRVSELSGLWREDRIKQVTGGESITASFKNAHLFTFIPRFKLLVTANEPPRLKSVGRDMSRRFQVYKFTRGVSEVDTSLPEKLRAEAGKILGWMIRGAQRYYSEGLVRSPAVEAATAEYFSDNDNVQQWMDECTVRGEDFRMSQASAYESVSENMKTNGVRYIPTRVQFQNKLAAKGIVKKNAVVLKGQAPVPALIGIRLKPSSADPDVDPGY